MRTRGCCQVCCAEGKAGARVSPWPTRMWTRVGGQGRTRRTCGARVSPCPRHVDSRRPAGEDAEEVRRTRIAVTHGTWTCGCAQRLIARGSPSAAQRGNAANQTASRSSCRRESSDSMNVSLPMTRRGFWRSEWFFEEEVRGPTNDRIQRRPVAMILVVSHGASPTGGTSPANDPGRRRDKENHHE